MKRIVIGEGVINWVSDLIKEHGTYYGAFAGIGLEEDGKLIAGVVYSDYNGANCCMHVASDGSKNWMTREYLRTVFDYPFNQAKVNRITGLVGEGNLEAQLFDEHVGFKLETELRNAHPTGNLLVYVMFREDCRWLGKTPLLKINTKRISHEQREAA